MSADWKAGDRALCVEKFNGIVEWLFRSVKSRSPMPEIGVVYIVSSVEFSFNNEICLHIAGLDDNDLDCTCGYVARKFRKIVPACDRVSVEQEQEAAP